ncbi:hypothetical protein HDV03_001036 [Kappamyces sp. JEL0829]|nr:hypothetical protein HDV03_001036 [Kappamyces sp. JEL0829]
MKVSILPLPQTGEAAVVDPAIPSACIPWIQNQTKQLVQLWTTHHHGDHSYGQTAHVRAGNARVRDSFPSIKIYGSDDRIPQVTHKVQDGESWQLGNLTVRALWTTGHTTGCISYYVVDRSKDETSVFTGDTLFIGGCGRFFEGTPAMMYHSLIKVLAALPPATKVYVAHEYTVANLKFAQQVEPYNEATKAKLQWSEQQQQTVPSTIAQELLINPFMRVETKELQTHSGISDPIELLGRLREMKNRGVTKF